MYKVNDNDKALFDQDGFLVVDRLIAADSLPPLHRAFDDLFHGHFETGVRPDEVNWQAATGDPDLTRQICNGWKANRQIARVVLDAGLAKNIATLGGWPGVRIMIDNLLWKPPATKSLGFHQDSAYLAWFTPSDLLTCWIALDDTRADGGTIEFVRGSHKWQPGVPEGEFHAPEDYRKPMRDAAAREGGMAPAPTRAPTRGVRWYCTRCVATSSTSRKISARASARFTAATNASAITGSTKTTFRSCGVKTVTAHRNLMPTWTVDAICCGPRLEACSRV
jgi:hypothetical protein